MKLRSLTAVEDESGLKGTSKLWRISIIVSFISLVIYVVGVCTSKWVGFDRVKYDPDLDDPQYSQEKSVHVKLNYGLWRKCSTYWLDNVVAYDDCEDMDNDDDWKPAAKVLCTIGVGLGVVGLAVAFWAGWTQNNQVIGAAGITVILAGLCGAIGSAAFVGNAKDSDDRVEPRFSVYLSLIGCAFLILSGGLQLLSIQTGYSTIA